MNGIDTTEGKAASSLLFDPVVPEKLGPPERVLITKPGAGGVTPRDLVFAVVYEHPDYGAFYITEAMSDTTQAELDSLAGCDPEAGCEGRWSLVSIREGTTALLIEGPVATSLVWLGGGVRFDVVGPSDTFSAEEAIEVANLA